MEFHPQIESNTRKPRFARGYRKTVQKGIRMSEEGAESSPKKDSDPRKAIARDLWERLAKSQPGTDNKDVIYLSRFVPLLSSAAVKTLLGRKLTLDELKELIQHVPKAREAATKIAIKQFSDDLTEEDLRFFFTQTKSADIGKYLLKRFPNDANLGLAERTLDDLKPAVAKMREQEPTKTVLREIDRKL